MRGVLRALFGRCPACGDAPLYVRFAELFETCPTCHVRHDRLGGSWLAAAGMSALVGLTLGVWGTVWLHTTGRPISLPAVMVVSSVAMIATYRPFKGLVFGTLHALGLVSADPVREGNVLHLDPIRRAKRARKRRKAV
jgi:uncharacterized protein (DUF983 family)